MSLGSFRSFISRLRDSGRLRNIAIYAGFVAVAFVFWCILALNEEAQTDFPVRVRITDVPDSVTFLTDPPEVIHVSVRDRGTHLLRLRLMQEAEIKLSFREFASDGNMRISSRALLTHMRPLFGQGSTMSIVSPDSISIPFTTMPGKLVPVRVMSDIVPELGRVVSGNPKLSTRQVKVFALRHVLDTITFIPTEQIVARGVTDSFTRDVKLKTSAGVRVEPASVQVTFTVEPLENRHVNVPVRQINVPASESLVLFPDKVEVSYLVPMSRGDVPASQFSVVADYQTITSPSAARMPVVIANVPPGVASASLQADSVEFTIIRHVPAKK
ncbi:MAG: YbbR-like domain-containing protein [Bacteroidales bacterium]|nr:YbbR-like domain-containing protein [Bacteroidales bacterium]